MWQVLHWPVTETLLWNRPLAQLAKLPRWQVSQLAAADAVTNWYGMCKVGLPSAGGYAPEWQLAHCAVTGTCVWLKRLGFQAVVVWQLMQFVAPTGMWFVGLPVAPVPLWQVVQLVAAVNVLWSILAPVQVVVERWQFSHTVWPTCTVVLGLMAAWQLAHWAVIVTFWCTRAGVHDAKPALWQVSQLAAAVVATS